MKGNKFFGLRRKALAVAALTVIAAVSSSQVMAATPAQMAEYGNRVNFESIDGSGKYASFIVHYHRGTPESQDQRALNLDLDRVSGIVKGVNLTHVRTLGIGAELVQLVDAPRGPNAAKAEELMMAFARNLNVAYIEADVLMQPLMTPNDTRYAEQWHYFDSVAGMNLPAAWDIATGSGVTVAVIDTGITPHSDLSGNVVGGYDFISDSTAARDGNGRDSNPNDEGDWFAAGECGLTYASGSSWHGSHVAGTIAAVTNNSKGVAGVAFNAKVSPVRVLGKCGGSLSDIADAITWASGGTVSGIPANGNVAKVINMSLGGGGSCGSTYQAAIDGAVSRGTVVIVAAGNSNVDVSGARPANCANVVAVAATDKEGNRAYYSNYGSLVDVAAPGGETNTTTSKGVLSNLNAGSSTQGAETYAFYQGTSMATPHVAGLAALILSKGSKTPAQIESLLKTNTRAFAGTCSGCGTGLVDSLKTLQALGGTPPPPPTGGVLTKGVPVTGLAAAQNVELSYTMVVPSGATGLSFAISGGTGDADLYVKFGSAPTTSSYDCRPYLGGNAETCNIATAQAGTYYVKVRAYTAFSGVSLVGNYTTGTTQPTFFENQANYNILDNTTVESPVAVAGRTGNAPTGLRVGVTIYHTYRGDVKLDLVAPDGSVYALKASSGSDGADNIITTYTVNASSEVANGTWKLRVQDVYSGDTGYLDKWSLTF